MPEALRSKSTIKFCLKYVLSILSFILTIINKHLSEIYLANSNYYQEQIQKTFVLTNKIEYLFYASYIQNKQYLSKLFDSCINMNFHSLDNIPSKTKYYYMHRNITQSLKINSMTNLEQTIFN